VNDIYEIKENPVKWEKEDRKSKMLIIGVNLDKEKIRAMLQEAIVSE